MKVNSVDNSLHKVSFRGYKPVKDDRGYRSYEFNFPFDEQNYDCYLELFNAEKDRNGNYKVTNIIPNSDEENGMLKLKPGPNAINLSSSYFVSEDEPFAYHYKLIKKGTDTPSYRIDAGDTIDYTAMKGVHEIYNLVTQDGSNVSRGGSMKLVIPDNYNVGYVYNPEIFSKKYIIKDDGILNKAISSNKHFSNKLGGTLAGIEKAIEDGDFDGLSSIVSTPIFTDDSLTPHSYWNKNCMQMAQSLGNINNYTSLQKKMFGKGINLVSDGAFVNEGLEGVHFANILKWGEKSPFYNWFKADGLKNGPLSAGVFSKNQEFISHKIVNSPYKYTQNSDGVVKFARNSNYNRKKPTYIQIFDSRLVSDKQKKDNTNRIMAYEKLNTENFYEINNHNDTVIPYSFEVNPETYHNNMMNLNEYNKQNKIFVKIDDVTGARFLTKFEKFDLDEKFEGGFVTWDANPDIAKLEFVYSHEKTEDLKNVEYSNKKARVDLLEQNNIQVQDYAITSGIYWTRKTNDLLRLSVAQNLKDINHDKEPENVYAEILNKISEGVFPKRLNQNLNINVVKNVLHGQYESQRVSEFYRDSFRDQIMMGLMNFPLDSIELGDNIAGVLSSPYVTKRAIHEEEIGLSRYDLYKKDNPHLQDEHRSVYKKTDKMYEREMLEFADEVIKLVDESRTNYPKLSSGVNTSLYGKYVLPLVTADIAKFAVIKSLKPDVKVFVNKETGEIGYDYAALKNTSLQSVGVVGVSPEDEASLLISKIKTGINKIGKKDIELLASAIAKSIQGTNVQSFALADMIVDRSQAGLDWRIDAAKDIANIDDLKNGNTDFDYTWQQVISFWKKFNDNVLHENPNAYLVAEVTDENDLHKRGEGRYSKRFKPNDITSKFLRESGMTSTANYSYFFTDIPKMFGKSFEAGHGIDTAVLPKMIYEKMIGHENYLKSGPLDSILYSYTFIGNHDKPRALHCLAIDMGMFYTDLTDKNNREYRERAYKILNDKFFENISDRDLNNFDFSRVSPKAVAMGETMRKGFIDTLNKMRDTGKISEIQHKDMFVRISNAISDMTKGKYMGKNFGADAFGVKPFDLNITAILKQSNFDMHLTENKQFENDVFESIMDPAISKLLGIMKYLVALPGKPTMYAGDDVASTGYESKTKNIHIQNRNYIHNEWLESASPRYKEFVSKHKNEFDEVMALRSRTELDALNNGAPFTLPLQKSEEGTNVSAILRQNTDGKMAISLFNTSGIKQQVGKYYTPSQLVLNEINLCEVGNGGNIGLKGGLREGTKFVNSQDKNDVYYVREDNGRYFIKRNVNGKDVDTVINDSTLILYHTPENHSKITFTGGINFKPQFNFVSKAYAENLK